VPNVFVVRLAVITAILLVAGCTSKNKGKIEGTKWVSQPTTIKGKSIPAGLMRLEFGTDGSLVYKVGPETRKGTYSLGMGDVVTLKLDREISGRKEHAERVEINGDRLTMKDSDGTSLSFSKVK
jgi:hypothetical protein